MDPIYRLSLIRSYFQFYEIVIFSENYMAEEIVMKLDPKVSLL